MLDSYKYSAPNGVKPDQLFLSRLSFTHRFNRGDDPPVGAAATDVAIHAFQDLFRLGRGFLLNRPTLAMIIPEVQ